jgi:hypothetical protein
MVSLKGSIYSFDDVDTMVRLKHTELVETFIEEAEKVSASEYDVNLGFLLQ